MVTEISLAFIKGSIDGFDRVAQHRARWISQWFSSDMNLDL
jgi:hypothetical protein